MKYNKIEELLKDVRTTIDEPTGVVYYCLKDIADKLELNNNADARKVLVKEYGASNIKQIRLVDRLGRTQKANFVTEQQALYLLNRSNKEKAYNIRGSKRDIKPDYIYLIRVNEYIKIGYSNNINGRLRQIQTDSPYEVELVLSIKVDNGRNIEKYLHSYFKAKRVRGEWFELNNDEVKEVYNIIHTYING